MSGTHNPVVAQLHEVEALSDESFSKVLKAFSSDADFDSIHSIIDQIQESAPEVDKPRLVVTLLTWLTIRHVDKDLTDEEYIDKFLGDLKEDFPQQSARLKGKLLEALSSQGLQRASAMVYESIPTRDITMDIDTSVDYRIVVHDRQGREMQPTAFPEFTLRLEYRTDFATDENASQIFKLDSSDVEKLTRSLSELRQVASTTQARLLDKGISIWAGLQEEDSKNV